MTIKWTDLIPIVKDICPLLATALGGPYGAIAGALISDLFGGNHQSTDDLVKQISSDSDAKLKLKMLEEQNRPQLEEIASKNLEIEAQDRQDARKNSSPRMQIFLLLFTILSLFSCLAGTCIVEDHNIQHVLLTANSAFFVLLYTQLRSLNKFYNGE